MDKRAKREELLGELRDIEKMLDKPHTPGFVPTLSDIVSNGTLSDDANDLNESNIPTLGDLDQYVIAPRETSSSHSADTDEIDIPMLDDVFDNAFLPDSNQQDLLQEIDPPQAETVIINPSESDQAVAKPTNTGENPFLPKAVLEKLATERHAAETEAANALETLKPNHAIADQIDHNNIRHELEIALDTIMHDVLDEYLPKIRQEIESRLQKKRQHILTSEPRRRS